MFRFGMNKIEPRDFAQVQHARKVKLEDNKRYKVEKGSSCKSPVSRIHEQLENAGYQSCSIARLLCNHTVYSRGRSQLIFVRATGKHQRSGSTDRPVPEAFYAKGAPVTDLRRT